MPSAADDKPLLRRFIFDVIFHCSLNPLYMLRAEKRHVTLRGARARYAGALYSAPRLLMSCHILRQPCFAADVVCCRQLSLFAAMLLLFC